MNDKRQSELIEALSQTDAKNKALQGLKDKIAELDEATEEYNKAKSAHKKEFLQLSKERTKLEVVKDEIDTKQEETDRNLQLSLDVLEGNNASAVAISEQARDIEALEKKTKASCRRKENAAIKALSDAEAFKEEAEMYKGKHEAKYKKLQDAMNG